MRLSKSVVGKRELDAVERVIIGDGYLGMGKEVQLFETEIATYLNVDGDSVVCVNSGTSALHLAVQSLVKPKDEILVPSLTFVSSFQAISAAGATPIPCDVNLSSLTIDLEDASKKITPRTRAIMYVHYASNSYYLKELYEFARIHGLRVIEDAAHSFGSSYSGRKVGAIGDITCFSFDGIKNITSGEGGCIVSNDLMVLNFVKDSRLLGIENDSVKRYSGQRSWDFDVKHIGYRFHMSNIFAAIGRVQLQRLDCEFAPKRLFLWKLYRELLSPEVNLVMQTFDNNTHIVPHIFVIRVLNSLRNGLKIYLEENGIPTGLHYKPNHLLSFFRGTDSLPNTELVYDELLTLPLHPDLSEIDVKYICQHITKFLKENQL